MCTKAKVVVYVLALCVRRRFRRRRRHRPTFAPRRRSSQAAGQALRTRRLRHQLLNHHLRLSSPPAPPLPSCAFRKDVFLLLSTKSLSLLHCSHHYGIYVCVYLRTILVLLLLLLLLLLLPGNSTPKKRLYNTTQTSNTPQKPLFLFVPSFKFFFFVFLSPVSFFPPFLFSAVINNQRQYSYMDHMVVEGVLLFSFFITQEYYEHPVVIIIK